MKKNIGTIDKVIRMLVGLFVVIYFGLFLGSWWGLLGVIPIITVATSSCTLYTIFGFSTCKVKNTN
jgi:hypothetical protein